MSLCYSNGSIGGCWRYKYCETSQLTHLSFCELPTAPGPETGAAQMWPKKDAQSVLHTYFNWQIAPILLGKLANTLQHHVLTCSDHALNHSWSLLDHGLSQILPAQPAIPPLPAPLVPQGLNAIFKPSLHGLLHDPSN